MLSSKQLAKLFSTRQISELITAIKGRGEIPLKFAYLGKGAKRWDDLAKLRGRKTIKGINSIEGNLLQSKSPNFLSSFKGNKNINLIDIGCGDGYPAVPLIKEMQKQKYNICYIPIDISREMINIARKNISKLFPKIKIKFYQLDFELGNFSEITHNLRHNGSVNLLAFLGSTIGNAADRYRVLSNFRDSMTSQDYIIIGVELLNPAKTNKLLRHYQNETIYKIQFTVLEYLGIQRSQGDFTVRFNNDLSQVETRFKFKQDINFKIGDELIHLEKDDELLLMRSVKFSDWGLVKLLSEVGFRIEEFTASAEKSYALAMCQPTRFAY